jgi:signal transduction histidine kinase
LLSVTDTGGGIPPENLSLVFEPFFTTKSGPMRTGLGLAMIYGFVKQSKGHIRM